MIASPTDQIEAPPARAAEAVPAPVSSEQTEAERLVCLGRMVSAVAHELNNRLTSVLGYAELLMLHAQADGQEGLVRKLHVNTSRLRLLTENISGFSRSNERRPVPCQLGDVLRQVAELSACVGKTAGIEVRLESDPDLPRLPLVPPQLRFAFFICLDAMNRALMESAPGHREVLVRATRQADGVRIEIQPRLNGCGLYAGAVPESPECAYAASILAAQGLQAGWVWDEGQGWRFVAESPQR
jgi:signal transduction histidine kinase